MKDLDSILCPTLMSIFLEPVFEFTFNDNNFQKFLSSDEKFDVVIVEQFGNDAVKALAHHFDAHLIVFTPVFASSWVNDFTGNPSPVSYVPEIITSYPHDMNFWQRTHNAILYLTRRLIYYHYGLPRMEILRKRLMPNAPSVHDLNSNVSLVLLNSHESYSHAIPLVPNMIPIGGYHIEPPKKLPEDLKVLLDSASEGVVYFSMGSNLQSSLLPEFKRNLLLSVLGKLKQKVFWKYEEDVLPGKAENIITRKWYPQADILAHHNVKLFITHGGILSNSEAIYHGVPLLAIPVYGDQVANAIAAENKGYALRLNYHDEVSWTEENLSFLLDQLLNDVRYREKAKIWSRAFHDRPVKPMDAINYWVNYVIRSKGAHHLKVQGITLPWYKYYLVDTGLFLLLSTATLLKISLFLTRSLLDKFRKSNVKTKKD